MSVLSAVLFTPLDSICLIVNNLPVQDYMSLFSTCSQLNNLKSSREFLKVLINIHKGYMRRGLYLLSNDEIFEVYNLSREFNKIKRVNNFLLYRKLKEFGYYDYVKETYMNRKFKGDKKIYNILSCSSFLDDFQIYRECLLNNLDIDLFLPRGSIGPKGPFMSLITISFKYDISLFIEYVEHNDLDILHIVEKGYNVNRIIENCSLIRFS